MSVNGSSLRSKIEGNLNFAEFCLEGAVKANYRGYKNLHVHEVLESLRPVVRDFRSSGKLSGACLTLLRTSIRDARAAEVVCDRPVLIREARKALESVLQKVPPYCGEPPDKPCGMKDPQNCSVHRKPSGALPPPSENPPRPMIQSESVRNSRMRFVACATRGLRFTGKVYKEVATGAQVSASTRQVRVICSTASVDRMGDVIVQSGIDLSQFKRNPIVLWGHDQNNPVARAIDIGVRNNRLEATVQFPPEGDDEDSDWVYGKIKSGIVNATSIGFIPLEYEPIDPKQPWQGMRFTKSELLEFSFVSVPANQDALIIGRGARAAR